MPKSKTYQKTGTDKPEDVQSDLPAEDNSNTHVEEKPAPKPLKVIAYVKPDEFHSYFDKQKYGIEWDGVVCLHLRSEADFTEPEKGYDVCLTGKEEIFSEYAKNNIACELKKED